MNDEKNICIKPITFIPTYEQAVILADFKARLAQSGRTGHQASNRIILGAAVEALAEKENALETLCAEGAPA